MLSLAMTGRIDKQIAAEMGISLGTVRVYWKRIRQKVGGTRSEVIAELARTSLKLDFDGERTKADKLAKDLDECMVREKALRAYESAFEHLPTPLAILDAPDGRLVRVNAAFASLHGYAVEELLETSSKDLMEPKEVTKFVSQSRRAVVQGEHFAGSSTRRRKDGSTFAASVTVSGDGASNWVLSVQG